MTEQEALKYIQSLANRIPLKFFTDREIQRYDEFSQVVNIALERRIPKKALIHNYRNDYDLTCNGCGKTYTYIRHTADRYNYCPDCGQKIDWRDE